MTAETAECKNPSCPTPDLQLPESDMVMVSRSPNGFGAGDLYHPECARGLYVVTHHGERKGPLFLGMSPALAYVVRSANAAKDVSGWLARPNDSQPAEPLPAGDPTKSCPGRQSGHHHYACVTCGAKPDCW